MNDLVPPAALTIPTPEIIRGIEDLRCRFIMERGVRPTILYLGIAEKRELMRFLEMFRMIEDRALVGKRMNYDGMEIYVVDAMHYAACGVLDDTIEGLIAHAERSTATG